MTKQTTQELQAIVDEAPPLFKTTKLLQDKWFYSVEKNMRSLDDIREILELRKEVERLQQESDKAHGWIALAMMIGFNDIDCGDELLKIIAKRDLEMQAKGVEDISKTMNDEFAKAYNLSEIEPRDWAVWNRIYGNMTEKSKQLRQQAKELSK